MPGGASWSAADDLYLWSQMGHLPLTSSGNLQTNPDVNVLVSRLALYFGGRKDGAIRARLKHLHNPEHSAYKRLNGIPNRPKFRGAAPSALRLTDAPSPHSLAASPSAHSLAVSPSAHSLAVSPSAHSLAVSPSVLATAPSTFDLASVLPTFDLSAAPPALSRGIATSLEMQLAATSLGGKIAATRSFDSSGRQICMYCRRLACSTSCPLQQCPLGDRSGDGFTRCRGTTLKGARCKVTSETPRHCGSGPLQLGGQYCEKHTQTATRASDINHDISMFQREVELNSDPGSFQRTLMMQAVQYMRIGAMSDDEFNAWRNQ